MTPVLIIILVLLPQIVSFCPKNCYCSRYWTKCSKAKLNGLPQAVRNSTEKLLMEWDNITELTEEMFYHSGLQKVHTLVFHHTQILSIQENAFHGMNHLKSLTISNNQIDGIEPGTFRGLQMLTHLSLSGNCIDAVYSRTFEGLEMLTNLDLSYNIIEELSHEIFDGMRHVNSCKPTETEMMLPHSESLLDISFNEIKHIDPGTFLGLCMFTHLSLNNNNLSVLYSDTFQGLTRLQSLDLRANNLRTIETGSFNGLFYLTSLHTNGIYDDLSHHIEILHAGIFQGIGRLGQLDLSYFDICVIEEGVFKNFRYLTDLDLSNNDIKNTSRKIFDGLLSLKSINLSANNITVLHGGTFQELSALIELDLAFNKIQILSRSVFQGLANLRKLVMYGNRIHAIRPGAFSGLGQLTDLDMRNNNLTVLTQDTFIDLVNLRNLYMTENNIHTIEEYAFRGLSFLKVLSLWENNITIVNNRTFYGLKRLDYLHMGSNSELNLLPGALVDFQVLKTIGLTVRHGANLSARDGDIFGGLLHHAGVQIAHEFKLTGINTILQPGAFMGLNVLTLDLSFNNLPLIKRDTFIALPMLNTLAITKSNVRKIFSGSFRNLYNLKDLYLDLNNIKSLEPGVFQGLTRLETLSVTNNKISALNEGVFGGLCKEDIENPCAYVKGISRNLRTVQRNTNCNISEALISLQKLDLSNNMITFIHPNTFIHNVQLQYLSLSGNFMYILDTNFLYIPSLQTLDISECHVSELPAEYFRCTPNLLVLNIYFNRIQTLDVELFKQIADLDILYMFGNPIVCDCKLKKIWDWIIMKEIGLDESILEMPCSDVDDVLINVLPALECNATAVTYNQDIVIPDNLVFFKQYVEPIILGLILLVGALGNGFLIFIFISHPDMRTGPNICIINLAIGDCLSLVVNLPLSYWDILNVSWDLGVAMCKLFMAARDVTVGVTVFSVVALSAQRYAIAARSFQKDRGICGFSESKTSAILILMVWGFALGFALPAFLTATVDTRCLYTVPDDEYLRRTWTIQLFVFCVIPVCVICFFNLKTAHHLKKSIHNMPGERQVTVQAEGRRRVANMVVVLTAVFCVSYMPNFLLRVLFVWSVLETDSELTFVVSFMSFCLFFCNSCFNPIALFSMSTTYRHLFLRHFRCRRTVSQNAPSPSPGEVPLRVLHMSRTIHL